MERLYLGHPPTHTLSHPPPHFNHDCHKISLKCQYCTMLSFLLLILICFLQLNISFNDKTEVFEYPSFEPVSPVQTMVQSSEEEPDLVSRLKSNTPVGSSGDIASFILWVQCNVTFQIHCYAQLKRVEPLLTVVQCRALLWSDWVIGRPHPLDVCALTPRTLIYGKTINLPNKLKSYFYSEYCRALSKWKSLAATFFLPKV